MTDPVKNWIVTEGDGYGETYHFYGPFTQDEAEAMVKKMKKVDRTFQWSAIELDPPEFHPKWR
jgi:hypothetical protein